MTAIHPDTSPEQIEALADQEAAQGNHSAAGHLRGFAHGLRCAVNSSPHARGFAHGLAEGMHRLGEPAWCPTPSGGTPPPRAVTADQLWTAHRAALGGKSAVTGAALPEALAMCNPGVQGAHWGLAIAVAHAFGSAPPPAPPDVTPEEQERIRRAVLAA